MSVNCEASGVCGVVVGCCGRKCRRPCVLKSVGYCGWLLTGVRVGVCRGSVS